MIEYRKPFFMDDETGATFWPTNAGMIPLDGSAAIRFGTVSLASFVGVAGGFTPYKIVLKDSSSRICWGYLAEADAALALGSELVTDGGFAATTEGSELSSGNLTVGKTYKITARTGEDFTADGSPDNNVNTIFQATGTNVTLDADDKVKEITFDSWTCGTGWGPEASAGALTEKAHSVAGTGGSIEQPAVVTIGKLFKVVFTVTNVTAGYIKAYCGSTSPGVGKTTNDTFTEYLVASGSTAFSFYKSSTFDGTIDDLSVKEVTHLGIDGCHVVSTPNGSTQNWASKDASFNYNDSSGYTFDIQQFQKKHYL